MRVLADQFSFCPAPEILLQILKLQRCRRDTSSLTLKRTPVHLLSSSGDIITDIKVTTMPTGYIIFDSKENAFGRLIKLREEIARASGVDKIRFTSDS